MLRLNRYLLGAGFASRKCGKAVFLASGHYPERSGVSHLPLQCSLVCMRTVAEIKLVGQFEQRLAADFTDYAYDD